MAASASLLIIVKIACMKVGLFVPCYIDQFYPDVARATLELLKKWGCSVSFPSTQTCCGQPMANAGFASLTGGCNVNFIRSFSSFDYIVAPSGSCVLHVKEHLHDHDQPQLSAAIKEKTFELTQFATDVLGIDSVGAKFPYRVGMHVSCHGQRMLRLSSMSERVEQPFSKAAQLLKGVEGLELVYPRRPDECCGFGGTFCVTEEAVSAGMGRDRVEEHEANGVQYITGGDISCLMHLEGILRRRRSPIKTIHIAQILNAS